jgi:hypothetical protein
MQNHPVIEGVLMVSVPPPARGPDVYFNIPFAETVTGNDNGVTQIGAAVIVKPAGIDDLDRTVLFGDQVGPSFNAVLPDLNDAAFRKGHGYLPHPLLNALGIKGSSPNAAELSQAEQVLLILV